ncbi:hypothetical protein CEXT_360281 [Caerostris extrusa]|uniref:Uncharacterized protein n=1 Tax=Caerostris extrusa TaxID=172846 RepID=A0AAV4M9T4_CAEEX|nr:hypothetical protein CEXT_360281 [Caerostris extrusa]
MLCCLSEEDVCSYHLGNDRTEVVSNCNQSTSGKTVADHDSEDIVKLIDWLVACQEVCSFLYLSEKLPRNRNKAVRQKPGILCVCFFPLHAY